MRPHHIDLIEDEEEDQQVNIVVDLSWNPGEGERTNCEGRRVRDREHQLPIDLNNSPQPEKSSLSPVPSDAATQGCENNMEAAFGKYIDWGRGTLDFMPDGRLTFYEGSNSSVASNDQFDYRDFDLNSVLEDVQSRENDVRTTPPVAANNNDNNADSHPSEDEGIPLWRF